MWGLDPLQKFCSSGILKMCFIHLITKVQQFTQITKPDPLPQPVQWGFVFVCFASLLVLTNLLVSFSEQEVVTHCKKLTKKNKEQLSDMMDVERGKGLKALSREQRERLEAYQHLFYLLQVKADILKALFEFTEKHYRLQNLHIYTH